MHIRRPSKSAVLVSAALALTLAAAACGGSGNNNSANPASSASSEATTNANTNPPVPKDLQQKPTVDVQVGVPAPAQVVQKDVIVGTGPAITSPNDSVTVNYVGVGQSNGKEFDSSWSHGAPVTFPLNGVIPGWSQGMQGMKVGGRRELVIPPSLGYGAEGQPPVVGPNETLVFVIDLLAVNGKSS